MVDTKLQTPNVQQADLSGRPYDELKRWVWIYFFLLIFEGALRKWVLPGLATPLLVVRDPVAIWLIWQSWQRGIIPKTPYIPCMLLIAIMSFLATLVVGHRNIFVAIFGLRILVLHFPLIFIIGVIFDRADILKMGKVLLFLSIPMVVLILLQFYSPQSAWVNRGVGGDMEGAGFSGAMGYMRPPATFSFITGTSQFFSLVNCFVIYFWLSKVKVHRILLMGASAALVFSIPLSISRGLFFQVLLTVIFAMSITLSKPQYIGKILLSMFAIVILFLIFSKLPFYQTASEAFLSRFELANKAEGGVEGVLLDRFLGGLLGALANADRQPFLGYGLGMGTNVGSMLLTGGRTFLISEGEWGRVLGEQGPVLGLGVIVIRLVLSAQLSWAAFQRALRGDTLAWVLLSFTLILLPQGQWAQPTSLGFSTLLSGLCMAALLHPEQKSDQEEETNLPNEQTHG